MSIGRNAVTKKSESSSTLRYLYSQPVSILGTLIISEIPEPDVCSKLDSAPIKPSDK